MTPQENYYRIGKPPDDPKRYPPPLVTMGDGGERDKIQPIITKLDALKTHLSRSLQKVSERGNTTANIDEKIKELEKTSREFRLPRQWPFCCL